MEKLKNMMMVFVNMCMDYQDEDITEAERKRKIVRKNLIILIIAAAVSSVTAALVVIINTR